MLYILTLKSLTSVYVRIKFWNLQVRGTSGFLNCRFNEELFGYSYLV